MENKQYKTKPFFYPTVEHDVLYLDNDDNLTMKHTDFNTLNHKKTKLIVSPSRWNETI